MKAFAWLVCFHEHSNLSELTFEIVDWIAGDDRCARQLIATSCGKGYCQKVDRTFLECERGLQLAGRPTPFLFQRHVFLFQRHFFTPCTECFVMAQRKRSRSLSDDLSEEEEWIDIGKQDELTQKEGESTGAFHFRWLPPKMKAIDKNAPVQHIVLPFHLKLGVKILHLFLWSPITPTNPEWGSDVNPIIINDPAFTMRIMFKSLWVGWQDDSHALMDLVPEKTSILGSDGERLFGLSMYEGSKFLDLYYEYTARLLKTAAEELKVRRICVYGRHGRAFMSQDGFRKLKVSQHRHPNVLLPRAHMGTH